MTDSRKVYIYTEARKWGYLTPLYVHIIMVVIMAILENDSLQVWFARIMAKAKTLDQLHECNSCMARKVGEKIERDRHIRSLRSGSRMYCIIRGKWNCPYLERCSAKVLCMLYLYVTFAILQ